MVSRDMVKKLIDREPLEKRIAEMGQQISKDYAGKKLMMVTLLKGGAMFAMELAKNINLDMVMDFMVVSSYGNERVSSGEVKIKRDLTVDITDMDILLVDDIVDTGRTLYNLKQYLLDKGAASVEIAAMLDKPSRRVSPTKVEYVGFEIDDLFVLGYGLDCDQYYRNLPYIAYVGEETN